jgi:hypothetical protein
MSDMTRSARNGCMTEGLIYQAVPVESSAVKRVAAVVAVMFCLAGLAARGGENLFPAGTFEQLGTNGLPVGWARMPNPDKLASPLQSFGVVEEGTNRYIRFRNNAGYACFDDITVTSP